MTGKGGRPPPPVLFTPDLTAPGRLDEALDAAERDRRRRQELFNRFRTRVTEQATRNGPDPYQLLAEAIRRLLREG